MLVARIKLNNKQELKKILWRSSTQFDHGEITYNIRPECIYKGAYGFLRSNCIDYVEGSVEPVNYYEIEVEVDKRKNLRTISRIVTGWMRSTLAKLSLIVLIVAIVAVVVGVINIILLYHGLSNLGGI